MPPQPKTPRGPRAARPGGRSRDDFGELSPAESELLECSRLGEAAVIADRLPAEKTAENAVRAEFLRFLALGGDEDTPVHERGIRLWGAWVEGPLNLQAVTARPMILSRCRIERIDARDADLAIFALPGSLLVDGLIGDRLTAKGIFFDDGFRSTGDMRLLGATIGGPLSFEGASLAQNAAEALHCDGAVISGDLVFARGFRAVGEVRLLGANVHGDLECGGGRFENEQGDALSCDRAVIGGGVFLNDGFVAIGAVRLHGIHVGGNLTCINGHFRNRKRHALSVDGGVIKRTVFIGKGFTAEGTVRFLGTEVGHNFDCGGAEFDAGNGGDALQLEGTRIAGAFLFRGVKALKGGVALSGMHVASLCDDEQSWSGGRGELALDGFTYDRLAGHAPTDAASRLRWLELQRPQYLAEDFRPQPWEQLAQVLRSLGHPDAARSIAVAKQKRLLAAGRIPWGGRTLHRLYGLFVGYGYRPSRLILTILGVWLLCSAAYWAAVHPDRVGLDRALLVPVTTPADAACVGPDADIAGIRCQSANPSSRSFEPLAFSADVLLPVVDLGYASEWKLVVEDEQARPLGWGRGLRYLFWFEIVFGWLAGLLLITVVRNLIKKD